MRILFVIMMVMCCGRLMAQDTIPFVVIGGGTSGVAAGIQAARLGVETHIYEPTVWLGGMLTSAGVSAFDGNHQLAGGIFKAFRDSLYKQYGGPQAVETGWVSNTLFEPHIGNRIFQHMTREQDRLQTFFGYKLQSVRKTGSFWHLVFLSDQGQFYPVMAKIIMDATALGTVVDKLNLPADMGMDSRAHSGEAMAPVYGNDIIQDLTYVAIVKDYGATADKTIPRPAGYDPKEFECACAQDSSEHNDLVDCETMLNYGRLPNQKYMLNWPNCGNDHYVNLLKSPPAAHSQLLQSAKAQTLRFIYYIQHELGYRHLGIADDEFPTSDGLALIPYHRESQRVRGKVRFSLPDLQYPHQGRPLYRTGIAVGDYPIDHHHDKNPDAPEIDFINIKVPSYNLPLGALIPAESTNLIVGEQNISVTNIVNGTTRLQPVVLGIGQAAGVVAATAILTKVNADQVPIRQVQQTLLEEGCILMPFIDVPLTHPYFESIQRVGLCGILKGKGVPYLWANQTWFYPSQPMSQYELVEGLRPWYPVLADYWAADGSLVTQSFVRSLCQKLLPQRAYKRIEQVVRTIEVKEEEELTRGQIAYLLDELLATFNVPIYWDGYPLSSPNKHKNESELD